MSNKTDEGREAYRQGKKLSDCPYTDGSEDEHDWEYGFIMEEEVAHLDP